MDMRRVNVELINKGKEIFNRSINFGSNNNNNNNLNGTTPPQMRTSPYNPLNNERINYFMMARETNDLNPQAPCNAMISKKA